MGYPFFGRLITDCLERTETAMTQEHAFKAAELSVAEIVQKGDAVRGRKKLKTVTRLRRQALAESMLGVAEAPFKPKLRLWT